MAAALEPSARGALRPALSGIVGAGWGLAAGVALLFIAEQRLDGVLAFAVHALVVVGLGAGLGNAVRRLRTRTELIDAVTRGLAALGEAVIVLEQDSLRIVHASATAAPVFGHAVEDLIGIDVRTLVDRPEERAQLDERRRLRAAGHRLPDRVTMQLTGADGTPRQLEWSTVPLAGGHRPLLLSVVHDVTPRVVAEQRLARERGMIDAAFDAAVQPIAALGADGRILRLNAASARLAGRAAGELIGRTPWGAGLMTRAQGEEVATALRAGRDPFQLVVSWRPGGKERVVAWSATATRDEHGAIRGVVSIGRDLTGLRAAEDRARRAHAALDLRSRELERSNADLAEFAALASDDLRSPIRAVSGFGDLLEAHAAPVLDARARSYLTALSEAAAHAEEMLEGLAAYGRLAHGEALARDVDCERTLDAVLTELADELDARAAVVTRDPLPVVPGDPDELRLLFSNLIANAVRHGAPERPQVHVGAERRGLGWQLSFADDGAGVPAAERQRIFQLFRRLHARGAHRGTGVGLAMCRRIVERHGGAIWVDDAEGGGSVFRVALPDREAR